MGTRDVMSHGTESTASGALRRALFTDEERADADAYATQFGVVVERLLG